MKLILFLVTICLSVQAYGNSCKNFNSKLKSCIPFTCKMEIEIPVYLKKDSKSQQKIQQIMTIEGMKDGLCVFKTKSNFQDTAQVCKSKKENLKLYIEMANKTIKFKSLKSQKEIIAEAKKLKPLADKIRSLNECKVTSKSSMKSPEIKKIK